MSDTTNAARDAAWGRFLCSEVDAGRDVPPIAKRAFDSGYAAALAHKNEDEQMAAYFADLIEIAKMLPTAMRVKVNAACPDPSLHRDEWIRADDVKRLVREIDVALNGEEGAAQQASLCDVAAQIEALSRAAKARAAPGEPSAEPTSEEILRKFVTSLTGYLGSVAYECPAQFVSDTQQRAQEVLNRAALAHPEARAAQTAERCTCPSWRKIRQDEKLSHVEGCVLRPRSADAE